MLTLNDGRSELWQWDTKRKLTVDADCTQVHFSNKVFGRSIDVYVVDGVAEIPDVLLQTDKDLTAWAFVGTAEDGYTKISKVFKVNKRNKPADYMFTPTDQATLGEILDRIEDLEKRLSGDVSKEDIQNAVSDYLDKNPVSVVEKDPTVSDWAKQTSKPKYTAKEVGAVSTVNGTSPDENGNVQIKVPDSVEGAVLYTEQELTEEQKTQARENIGADFASVRILETDPAEPKEGMMWILRITTEELTTPVIELGEVGENSIAIKLSNASFDGSGAVVATYNIYVNGVLNKTESIAAGGTCVVTGLSTETEYQIFVRGVKGAVISAASNTLIATTEEADEPVEPKIVFVPGVSAANANGNITLGTNKPRATGVYTVGDKACVNLMESSDTYYPIPVPADATSITVDCPNLMYGYCGYNLSNANAYSYDVDSGWKASGETYQFSVGAAEYATISLKKTDGSHLTADDIANITVTFGTNSEPSEPEVTEQEIVIQPGYFVVNYDGNNLGVHITPHLKRAVAVSTSGKQIVPPTLNGVQYYLLEVPDDATSCTVVCPNMMWGYNGWNTGSDGKLTYDVDSGWQSSGATYQFEVGAAEYVSIGFKKVPETKFVAEDVTGISITFA